MRRIVTRFRFSQPDLTKGSGLIQLSNVSRHGQSVAASVVSDDSKVKQVRKRVPRDERRAMVDSYAIKYKELNDGKFPNVSETQKQVGGSYYVIKSILHEVEHRSKEPNMDAMHEDASRNEVAGVNTASANAAAVSTSHHKTLSEEVIIPRTTVDGNDVDLGFSNIKIIGAEQEPKTPTLAAVEEVDKLKLRDNSPSCTGTLKHESEAEPEEVVVRRHGEKNEHDVRERSPSEGRHPQRELHNPSPESDKLDLTTRSNVSRCAHPVALSVVSDDSKVKRFKERVPRDERRAMVESYIIKFKALNGEKFPTGKETRKQVGGSYYVIRNILQEIKQRPKAHPTSPMHEDALREEEAGVHKVSTNVTPTSTSRPVRKTLSEEIVNPKTTVDGDEVDLGFSKLKSVGSEQEPDTSTLLTKTLTDGAVKLKSKDHSFSNIGTLKHDSEVESEEMVVHLRAEKTEHDGIERSTSEGEHSERQHHMPFLELDKLAKVNSEGKSVNEELPEQTSMWGNLKSLAHGIFKKWRGL